MKEMDVFKQRFMNQHWETMVDFLKFVESCAHEDSCDASAVEEMLLFTENVVLNNPNKKEEGVRAWVANMKVPLDVNCVKYARAVQRVLKQPAVLYHAFQYRDIVAVEACNESPSYKKLDIASRTRDWSENRMKLMWKYFDELNRTAFEAIAETPPIVPTREDIAKNIQARREAMRNGAGATPCDSGTSDGRKSMNAALSRLHEMRGRAPADDETIERCKARLKTLLDGEASDDAALLSKEGEPRLQQALGVVDADGSSSPFTEKEKSLVSQIIALGRFEKAMPSQLLSRVENIASRLSSDIMSGKMQMDQISSEVASQISASDVDSLVGNIDGVLPALQSLLRATTNSNQMG